MSIEIKITDPANTPVAELQLIIRLLSNFTGSGVTNAPETPGAMAAPAPGPTAAEAFGASLAPEQVFSAAPFVPGSTPAPFIAGATPSSIAQDDQTLTLLASAPSAGQTLVLPPANAAPIAAPLVQHATPAPGVVLDISGLPWDPRIHAKAAEGGGTKNADGKWRMKRGVTAADAAPVEAQLRQLMGAPAPVPNVAPLVPSGALPPVSAGPAPTFVAPAAATSSTPTNNYVELIQIIGTAMAQQKLTQEEVVQICQHYGVPDLPLLGSRLDLVASVSQSINATIASKG